ncbi:hypothetical protein BJ165DRAFT_1411381 [Panaeolus papilionaceus]|nr:hypothetical protein BJ165DRAFT_1411381 [Panaeolus papilionaceus]
MALPEPIPSHPTQEEEALWTSVKKHRAKENKIKRDAFNEAVFDIKAELEKMIKAVADEHKRDIKVVREQVLGTLNRKTRKASNLDVMVSKVSADLAEKGESAPHVLKTLRKEVHEDLLAGLFTEEQIQAAREEYEERKKLVAIGARANAKAAVVDATFTAKQLSDILHTLYLRTGVVGLLLLSKPHVDDFFTHTLIEVNGSSVFFYDFFKRPVDEVMRAYEQFICARLNTATQVDTTTVSEKQAMVAEQLSAGLSEITEGKCTTMSYAKYDKLIRIRHHVELVGWPADVSFTPPKQICNTTALTTLLTSLKNWELCWSTMTEEAVTALAKEVLEKEKLSGKKPGVNKDGLPRKKRVSGKTTKRTVTAEDNSVEQPSKKQKKTAPPTVPAVTQLPPTNRSPSVVPDSDIEEEDATAG